LRILYQCNGFLLSSIGGAEVLSYHLAKALVRRGHEILVVAPRAGSDPLGRQTFDGLDIVRLDFANAIASRELAALRSAHGMVADVVSSFRPDVVYLNDTWVSSFFFLRGGATGNLPRALTLHSEIRPPGKDGLQARLAADADRVIAVSQAQRDKAAEAMPTMSRKLSVILNALPMPDLQPADLPFAPPVLLCAGRLIGDKGIDLAVRALACLRDRGIAARLTIAGNGRERGNLETLVGELGLADRVEFTNWVLPDRVPALINQATIVLMPSRWPEPFGLVALQAAQMARPTVAAAVGGLPEVVDHGLTGLLVEPENAHAIADAVQQLLSHSSEARRLGENARLRTQETFAFETMVDAYERVFAEVRAGAAGRPDTESIVHA
jgi:glycogen(starch) synthase